MPMKLLGDVSISDAADGVGTIADSITNNGTLVTILAVFIGLFILFILIFGAAFIYLYKKSIDKSDKTDDMKEKVVGGMLEKIGNHISNEITSGQQRVQQSILDEIETTRQEIKNPQTEKKDLIKLLIDTNLVFRDASELAINSLGAFRIAIYVFHNGNKSSHGLPFIKVTCIHEMFTNKKTSSSRGRSHNNMPLHLFFEIANGIYQDQESNYVIKDVDAEINKGNRGVIEYIEQSPIKAFFVNGIEDTNNIISGFTVAEFLKPMDFDNPDVYDKVKDALDIMNGTIRYIVSNEDFRNEYHVDN